MQQKKVLMWMSESSLKPIGGPSGYLYNIFNESNNNSDCLIEYLPAFNNTSVTVKNRISIFLFKKFILFKYLSWKKLLFKKDNSSVDLSKYDFIHFHDTISLFKARDLLNSYMGKVILTSHSPKPLYKEITEDFFHNLSEKRKKVLEERLKIVDEYAFLKADLIMFPCEEAKEPYLKWEFFKNLSTKYENKFVYTPTGCQPCSAKINKDDFRKQYNIPPSAFLISYVGRHSEVKGYDVLKQIGEAILKDHKDVYFIIAGKESPLKGLKHSKWIEVGYTSDPHSLIAASDLFILPNRETYFDLILLEVISLGKQALISNTGGNKYFRQFNEKDLLYFDDVKDAVSIINKLINYPSDNFSINNYNLYKDNFTIKSFISKYCTMLQNMDLPDPIKSLK